MVYVCLVWSRVACLQHHLAAWVSGLVVCAGHGVECRCSIAPQDRTCCGRSDRSESGVVMTTEVRRKEKFDIRQEVGIIPAWAFVVAIIVFVAAPLVFFGFV